MLCYVVWERRESNLDTGLCLVVLSQPRGVLSVYKWVREGGKRRENENITESLIQVEFTDASFSLTWRYVSVTRGFIRGCANHSQMYHSQPHTDTQTHFRWLLPTQPPGVSITMENLRFPPIHFHSHFPSWQEHIAKTFYGAHSCKGTTPQKLWTALPRLKWESIH